MTDRRRTPLALLLRLGTRFYLAAALVAVYAVLVGYGLVFAHATGEAESAYPTPDDIRHLMHVVLGLACGIAAAVPPWRLYERWAYVLYAFAQAALVAVLVFGPEVRGTKRWIDLGFTNFQVSELAKLAVVLALARYLAGTRERQSVGTTVRVLLLTLLPVLLIMKEPDLGTSLLLAPSMAALLFCARGRTVHLALLLGAACALAPFMYEFGLADYQRRRVIGFLSPDASKLDPDAVLQRERAREAIGTGGVWGKGLGEGDRGLPVRRSDFIFAAIAEEAGFAGAAALLGCYALFLYFCCALAQETFDLFGRLACVGIGVGVACQALVNAAMAVGALPVTGVTLPLISQGGSSIVATSIGVGLAVNIALRPTHNLARRSRLLRTR
jgi:rod shape determining protein RodA